MSLSPSLPPCGLKEGSSFNWKRQLYEHVYINRTFWIKIPACIKRFYHLKQHFVNYIHVGSQRIPLGHLLWCCLCDLTMAHHEKSYLQRIKDKKESISLYHCNADLVWSTIYTHQIFQSSERYSSRWKNGKFSTVLLQSSNWNWINNKQEY